jgi:hypothetical protein
METSIRPFTETDFQETYTLRNAIPTTEKAKVANDISSFIESDFSIKELSSMTAKILPALLPTILAGKTFDAPKNWRENFPTDEHRRDFLELFMTTPPPPPSYDFARAAWDVVIAVRGRIQNGPILKKYGVSGVISPPIKPVSPFEDIVPQEPPEFAPPPQTWTSPKPFGGFDEPTQTNSDDPFRPQPDSGNNPFQR